jgi:L-lactate dehydrogenase complex protein LldF
VNKVAEVHGSAAFTDKVRASLQETEKVKRRDMLGLFMPLVRDAAVNEFEGYEPLRKHVKKIKQHSLDNLHHYLSQFVREAENNGNHVHFAHDSSEMNSIVLDICQQHDARRIVKGKSMVTEETHLLHHLQSSGLDVVETDLGEYIIQQLREHFLKADVGIIGSNALIAESGYSMLVTNEGNGDLCANLPRVLIICTTLDRVVPRAGDAMALLRLLVRSATGQAVTCYTSFYSGPRREKDSDGPIETHIVLLDNKRSDILASDYREMLQCIRCGACLNHCPIYIGVGGHAYGSVYMGPMGSVLTPLLTSLEESNALPNACTACGRCEEVCPASIPLPDLLRDLRHDETREKLSPARWRVGIKMHAWLLRHPWLYQKMTAIGIPVLAFLGRKNGSFKSLILANGWTNERDFPAPQGRTFMQQYRSSRGRNDD